MRNLISLLFLFPAVAFAGGVKIHPQINVDNSQTTISYGLDDAALARGLTMAASAGSHQFDFSSYDWQGSVTGAWYDDEDAVSFGLAKRWEKVDALFHVNYTQNGSENLYVVGGTFRF